ncbi:MAG: magnesium transporter [Rhizobiales bacterium 65-9]|nr:magnesium transporter CorA family protein [Hyphomicrobiales bacterium]OJY38058.1 MAG: magnesium transporter [Rhizobiales bacterium 65-9]
MILVYTASTRDKGGDRPGLEGRALGAGESVPKDALWIDMIEPTREEDRKVEAHLGIEIPTREEMSDIEPSEIIYAESNARYMTARILCSSDSDLPRLANVSFILAERALVTVRYDEPRSFTMFAARSMKPGGCGVQPESVLDGLIETIIDRAAEILATLGGDIEKLSRSVFEPEGGKNARGEFLRTMIRTLGRKGDIISNVRESMVSVERVLLFLSATMARPQKSAGFQAEWRTALRDVQSIEEHATFLASKIQFLLDATLGLVSLEQNDIIKLFSVMAVVLMPPTLIASIYGMNFKNMPELDWAFGYPAAIGLMIVFAILPFIFFRWKRWL